MVGYCNKSLLFYELYLLLVVRVCSHTSRELSVAGTVS